MKSLLHVLSTGISTVCLNVLPLFRINVSNNKQDKLLSKVSSSAVTAPRQVNWSLQGVSQTSWLPCQFTDEHVFLNQDNHTETQLLPRDAVLQFGGEAPVNPHTVTFLVTASKVDLLGLVEEFGADRLECDLRRVSTRGIQVRWPGHGGQDYDHWFSCTLKHTQGLFTATGYLRHTPAHPPSGQQDYFSWPAIGDRDVLATSAAMVIQTRSPSVRAGLRSEQKLHCQFSVDHRAANVDVEWHFQQRGERSRLFSYAGRSGQTTGTGVRVKGLARGDATFTLPLVKLASEGTYICSASVPPILATMDVTLHIEEPPLVSLSVGSDLSLPDDGEQKVVCAVEGYYPLDVEIVWYQEEPGASSGQRVGAPLPKKLQNILLSSHKHSQDGTYSLSAFFYLQASLRDSGSRFTCSVSHRSLRMPIRKSFVLTVHEPSSWMLNLFVGFIVLTLLVIIGGMLSYLNSDPHRETSSGRDGSAAGLTAAPEVQSGLC
ncbi:tapasin-related protein-like [Diretmus argenteus]